VTLEKLKIVLLNPSVIFALKRKVEKKLKAIVSGTKIDTRTLLSRKKKIQTQIDNLLTLVERGDLSDSIKSRIEQRERELREVTLQVERSRLSGEQLISVSADWIKDKLLNLSGLIGCYPDKVSLLRNELRSLFPEKLMVSQATRGNEVEFRIKGNASPFNLLLAGDVQLCMASPRGFEPLLPP
jgi:hypothetical protein